MNGVAPFAAHSAGGPTRLPLKSSTLVLYGLPNLATSVAALPVALLLPAYYADDLGLPFAAVGVAITLSRVFDVVTDPLIGTLSDRTRSRFGRRKLWMAAGTPVLMLAIWQLFLPGSRGEVSVLHLGAWSALLYLGFTIVDLPYKAWGAELSDDYAERSRITAWREGWGFAGQIGVLLLLALLGSQGVKSARVELEWIALTMLASMPPLVAMALWIVPEPVPEIPVQERLERWSGLVLVVRNPAFARMIGAVLCFVSGVFVQGTLHKLVLTYHFGEPALFAPMILLENVASLAAVPLWLRVSDRVGKHRAVALAALWLGLFSLGLPFFDPSSATAFVVWMALRGSSFASILFLANSMAADVVDHDTVASGKQRTGLYFGVWGLLTKGAIALGLLLATTLPASLGFDPGSATPDAAARTALMGVYGFVPGLLMAAGSPFLWNFPIDRAEQERLRAQLAERRREPIGPKATGRPVPQQIESARFRRDDPWSG
jgi:Na+/melibiose symporter-like transporter